eukprot:4574667-Pyramimonas_sp.AAC.1
MPDAALRLHPSLASAPALPRPRPPPLLLKPLNRCNGFRGFQLSRLFPSVDGRSICLGRGLPC